MREWGRDLLQETDRDVGHRIDESYDPLVASASRMIETVLGIGRNAELLVEGQIRPVGSCSDVKWSVFHIKYSLYIGVIPV